MPAEQTSDQSAIWHNCHLHRLFEPFFTTQSQSEGTGLGLYVTRELAQANKGDLRYDVAAKAFELILPRVQL